jgi:hypothetical protein
LRRIVAVRQCSPHTVITGRGRAARRPPKYGQAYPYIRVS